MIREIVSDDPHQSFFDWVRGRFDCPDCGRDIKKVSAAELFPKEVSDGPLGNFLVIATIRVSVFLSKCIFSDCLKVETGLEGLQKVYFTCPRCSYQEIIWKKYGRLVQGPLFYRYLNANSVKESTQIAAEKFLKRKFRGWVSESHRNCKKILEAATSSSSLRLYYYPSSDTVEEQVMNKERYRLLEVSEENFLRAFVGMHGKPDFFDLVKDGWISAGGEREKILSFNEMLIRRVCPIAFL